MIVAIIFRIARVNPLFNLPPKGLFDQHYSPPDRDDRKCTTRSTKRRYDEFDVREKSPEIDYEDDPKSALRHSSVSSGYSGSSISENGFGSRLRPVEEVAVLDQNPAFVKSIRIAGRGLRTTKLAPSQHSSSSGAGTLSTIPEGRVDASLHSRTEMGLDISIRDLLMDLLTSIGQARSPEDALRKVDEKIRRQLEMLRCVTEEDMRRLCVSLSRGRQVNSVLRALSRSPSSGQSSNSGRVRSSSIQEEDFYHIPSGSSSSGFSDSPPGQRRPPTPLSYGRKPSISLGNFPAEESSTLSRGIRNALIYGTLYRQKTSPAKEPTAACDSDLAHSDKTKNCDRKDLLEPEALTTKMGHLESARDNKPSVWEMYYGVKAEGSGRYGQGRPSDVPIFAILAKYMHQLQKPRRKASANPNRPVGRRNRRGPGLRHGKSERSIPEKSWLPMQIRAIISVCCAAPSPHIHTLAERKLAELRHDLLDPYAISPINRLKAKPYRFFLPTKF
ncbi:hypothetical protein GWI33_022106 [Rhynchophorus ferrugineus]|uniref:Uncharacterized protein n=1 Tax=Rhynchophorus ferrugineus TaxID=354439 RepID=A0A834MLF9_RHYFE|nr:hypothetical protein GWI33_022106 [Rhynchophorus ferrugineus]